MRLHEYQAKAILRAHGVPAPPGDVASSGQEARRIAEQLGVPVAVKAQVLAGGRGKAGGIRLAHSVGEAEARARALLGATINGFPVRKVLIEQAVDIRTESYLGITLDRAASRLTLMASAQGGVDIEQVAKESPGTIARVAISPLAGLRGYQTLALGKAVGLDGAVRGEFHAIAQALYDVAVHTDARLAEINPLVLTAAGHLLALDGKIVLDDNALFRHPELCELRDPDEESDAERQARSAGMTYVAMEGSIGCLVNGAGLAMATADLIAHFGARPANFLDIGGGARAENVALALRLVLSAPGVEAVLLNIFGGITRCDEVARGIVATMHASQRAVPLVVRLVGTKEAEGRAILEESGLPLGFASTLEEGAQAAVALARARALGAQDRMEWGGGDTRR